MSKGCSSCNSERIAQINGKVSDMFSFNYDDRDYDGYVPRGISFGHDGDYIEFAYCLDCGKIQSVDFPVSEETIGGIFNAE